MSSVSGHWPATEKLLGLGQRLSEVGKDGMVVFWNGEGAEQGTSTKKEEVPAPFQVFGAESRAPVQNQCSLQPWEQNASL